MTNSMYFGNSCQGVVLSSLVRPALPTLQPPLDVKPFLPFHLDTSPIGLFPGFSTSVVGVSRSEQGSGLCGWKSGLASRRHCVSMDPVQKAIMNHTFGLPPPPKRKHAVSCRVCQLKFNSENQATAHFKGTKHARKLKALETPDAKRKAADAVAKETMRKDPTKSLSPSLASASTDATDSTAGSMSSPPSPPATRVALSSFITAAADGEEPSSDPPADRSPEAPGETDAAAETEEQKAKRLLYCSLCKVAVNSASQLEAHNSGTKHKTMLEARTGGGAIKSFPRPGVKGRLAPPNAAATGLQNKTFYCEICDVHVNSETQLKQHISSRRHKDRAAGKPAKPKYSPYNKPPRGPSAPAVRLAVRKELDLKPLAARLLPGHLAAAAVSPLSLRSAPAVAAALLQSQPLPPALLPPAPGPVRTSHPSVLFAPY
ncbi:zinc finger protein 385D-like isoform X2 [Megalops cyprinoides]|uniref:zinc finger protein 385D-like isoform X2 n=1 Tax=Megalops cyprinoides TaxID=118141 RepID=UPI001863F9DE|nr:zinc finger protein 385D-like isoform X2 [Megalops cyprinoides]